ncbi:hypothetical protein [Rhizobium sp. 21-4511-3d]
MAFSGIHVVCGFAGIDGYETTIPAIIKNAAWSESPASGVTSTNAAPQVGPDGAPIFRINVSADSYVSIGPSPNSGSSPRHLLLASQGTYDIGVKPGDKIQWVAA